MQTVLKFAVDLVVVRQACGGGLMQPDSVRAKSAMRVGRMVKRRWWTW